MRWQKIARFVIAAFVIAFTAFVVAALRRPGPEALPETTPRRSPDAVAETHGGHHRRFDDATGKLEWEVSFESQVTYEDGRNVLKNAVVTLPDRGGRTVTIAMGEMEAAGGPEGQANISTIKAYKGVRMRADDGLEVTTPGDATFDDRSGFLHIPGDVQFTRGRMSGTGVGATYDRGRDVLWLLDRARIDVKPDAQGQGAAKASAKAAGFARQEHYVRLAEGATIESNGQKLAAHDITIHMTDDDQAIRLVVMRGDSSITAAAGGTGAERMAARDIDLSYAEDGRTLREARLMESAQVALAGGRRVTGRTIDLGLGPDGTTVTALQASGDVQLDLPGEAGAPPRRITAPALKAGGPEGLQTGTFSGGTTYREMTAGRGNAPGRTARAQTLVVQTQPGLGALTEADFRGQVRIEDGATVAEGRRAVYKVAQDRFELVPSTADSGPAPTVTDERMNVSARTIVFSVAGQKLQAEGDVRSAIQPESGSATPAGRGQQPDGGKARTTEGGKLPALLKDGEPVNVTAKRLDYDGAAGLATYTGNALLFQNKTSIRAETIVIDDQKGNLTARGNVRSVIFMEEMDAATKTPQLVQTTATGDTLVYEDAARLATYTTGPTAKAHLVGTQGDVTGDRIRLFLEEQTNALKRAEAEQKVTLKEGVRVATGDHLTYTPATDTYVMQGRPVIIEEKIPGDCRIVEGVQVTFQKAAGNQTAEEMRAKSDGVLPVNVRPCGR